MQQTIQCGADIHGIGTVLPTPRGSIVIIGKRIHSDYVEYIVEQAQPRVISSFAPPSRLARLREGIRERFRGWFR